MGGELLLEYPALFLFMQRQLILFSTLAPMGTWRRRQPAQPYTQGASYLRLSVLPPRDGLVCNGKGHENA